jgi:CheY-like chemotaxis protein
MAHRILVIEDDPEFRELLSELLEGLGHHVAVAADGPNGVKKFLEFLPDLVLVDLGLPGIDGYEVARRIRASEPRRVFLVALTGYGGPEVKALLSQAGFDRHLEKPIALEALSALVEVAPA